MSKRRNWASIGDWDGEQPGDYCIMKTNKEFKESGLADENSKRLNKLWATTKIIINCS